MKRIVQLRLASTVGQWRVFYHSLQSIGHVIYRRFFLCNSESMTARVTKMKFVKTERRVIILQPL
jgi:hypothetical protein